MNYKDSQLFGPIKKLKAFDCFRFDLSGPNPTSKGRSSKPAGTVLI